MTLARLVICVAGIYASCELFWYPYKCRFSRKLTDTLYSLILGFGPRATLNNTIRRSLRGKPRYFRSVVFLNTVQSAFSATAALVYLFLRRKRGLSALQVIGLGGAERGPKENGVLNGNGHGNEKATKEKSTAPGPLLARCFQCALLHSFGSPFGFASLRHIDFPTMILGKSCKLVPVMLMNIVLYRRKFAVHKYMVVAMVTTGISLFMLLADHGDKAKKGAESSSMFGLGLLLVNLLIDGATNSTQDEIFSRFAVSGSQLMLIMNSCSTILTLAALVVPMPAIPILNPGGSSSNELSTALAFIHSHPAVLRDILLFSLAGAVGQLFIFETLAHFGSLTLVTITVTRKLFTMLLSVFVFDHTLTIGQWLGVGVVFAGIGLEAYVKMGHGKAAKIVKETSKARVKDM